MIFDLSRIEGLLDLLGSPQRAYPAIHLTGTNGKTSTARMIDSLLRAHGLRTGRYTSPHLATVRERISIDGEPVSEERFVEIYEEVAPAAAFLDARSAGETLTYFDMTTAMALAAFADAPVDVAVVEVGLGGADDSTNVLQAAICVITPIGLDHMEWLGDTVEEIAMAKAGIIHGGASVLCATQPPDALRPLAERCADVGATLLRQTIDFDVRGREVAVGGQLLRLQGLAGIYDDIFVPLHGAHQAQNAAVALAAVEAFLGAGAGTRQLDPDVVRAGFASATSPGRLERVRTAPTVLLDAAHNPHGMAATIAAIREEFSFSRLVAVLGVLADKDVAGILTLLEPVVDAVVCTRSSSTRAMSPQRLGELAVEVFGAQRVTVAPSLPDAIEAAVALAESGPDSAGAGVLITGSVVTVADARTLLVRSP
ncbi:MAG TPA: folylpolyglutamate synthase/dihydrofolate synthase family protein [Micromonosporaceae bacterium]|jgi:dihydrofolate synthase/folylpolyglutamate synthase